MCYDMCCMKMICVVCNTIIIMMHVTFMALLSQSQFCKSSDLTSKNNFVRKEPFFLMHVLGVCFHIPILSTSVY